MAVPDKNCGGAPAALYCWQQPEGQFLRKTQQVRASGWRNELCTESQTTFKMRTIKLLSERQSRATVYVPCC